MFWRPYLTKNGNVVLQYFYLHTVGLHVVTPTGFTSKIKGRKTNDFHRKVTVKRNSKSFIIKREDELIQ